MDKRTTKQKETLELHAQGPGSKHKAASGQKRNSLAQESTDEYINQPSIANIKDKALSKMDTELAVKFKLVIFCIENNLPFILSETLLKFIRDLKDKDELKIFERI